MYSQQFEIWNLKFQPASTIIHTVVWDGQFAAVITLLSGMVSMLLSYTLLSEMVKEWHSIFLIFSRWKQLHDRSCKRRSWVSACYPWQPHLPVCVSFTFIDKSLGHWPCGAGFVALFEAGYYCGHMTPWIMVAQWLARLLAELVALHVNPHWGQELFAALGY